VQSFFLGYPAQATVSLRRIKAKARFGISFAVGSAGGVEPQLAKKSKNEISSKA
jgi:hypothetical protein